MIFEFFSLVLLLLSFYFITKAKRVENDLETKSLNFFLLGIFFFVIQLLASILVDLDFVTLLFSNQAILVYSYLTPLCFLFGLYFLSE